MMALTLIFLAIGAVHASPVLATDAYYVSTTGSDANPGTLAEPWRTVQKAAGAARSGDTVHVRAGTYDERVTLAGVGTASAPILIRGYGTERPLVTQGFCLSGSYTTVRQFEVTPGYQDRAEGGGRRAAISVMGTRNTVDDVRVHDLAEAVGQEAIFMGAGAHGTLRNSDFTDWVTWGTSYVCGYIYDHNTIQNCVFHAAQTAKVLEIVSDVLIEDCDFIGPNRAAFVSFNGKNSTLRNCNLYGVGRPVGDSTHTETIGFQRASFSPADGIIEGNTVDGCVFATPPALTEWDPVRLPGVVWDDSPPFHIFFFGHITAVTYRDNVFTNNVFLPGATRLIDMNGTNTTMGTQYFYNNLFEGVGGPSLDSANMWRNNICGEGFEIRSTTGGAAQDSDYNFYDSAHHPSLPTAEGPDSAVGDPAFVNPTMDATTRYGLDADWHVTSSELRLGVTDAHSPTLDKSGRTRVAPITVGPYEYDATPPAAIDATPPGVALTAPIEGAVVSGSVDLAAVASDADSGVARVEFRVDGTLILTDTSAPYAAVWDASSASGGSHAIGVTAYDVVGNSASSSVFVTVPSSPDVTPPGPVSGLAAVRTASVTLSWTNPLASDFAGVRVLRSADRVATSAADTIGQQSIYEGTAASYHDDAAPDGVVYYSVFARDTAGNWSAPASAQVAAVLPVAPAETSLALTLSATTVAPGRSVDLRGRLLSRGAEVRYRNDIAVWKKVASGAWSFDSMAPFDPSTGYYRTTRTPLRKTAYQMRFAGDATLGASLSSAVAVRVSSSVSRVALSRSSVRRGARVALTARVAGPPTSSVRVRVYRLVHKRWKYYGAYKLRIPRYHLASMRYKITVRAKHRGAWRFVAVVVNENGVAKGTVSRRLRVR